MEYNPPPAIASSPARGAQARKTLYLFACKTYLKTETGFGAVALIAPQGKECFSFLVRSFFFRRYEKERMNKNKTLF